MCVRLFVVRIYNQHTLAANEGKQKRSIVLPVCSEAVPKKKKTETELKMDKVMIGGCRVPFSMSTFSRRLLPSYQYQVAN